jgi:hypothetical protein
MCYASLTKGLTALATVALVAGQTLEEVVSILASALAERLPED